MEFSYPEEKKARVIINTDAKNEADDQFAIVHAVLTKSFQLHGIISTHFGDKKSKTSMEDSYEETMHLLRLMKLENEIVSVKGATHAMPDEETPVDSPGARMIIEEAMKDDDRPLHIAFYGPLTEMASALLLEPAIEKRNIRVIWIGGGSYDGRGRSYQIGGNEYNLSNDIPSANVVLKSKLEVWQIPKDVYRTMHVGYAELVEKVYPHGEIGKYLVKQLIEFNEKSEQAIEFRSLGDSPCIGVIMYPDCGEWEWRPAPEFDDRMFYHHTGQNRPIKVYKSIDARFIHEDFYAKLAQFVRNHN